MLDLFNADVKLRDLLLGILEHIKPIKQSIKINNSIPEYQDPISFDYMYYPDDIEVEYRNGYTDQYIVYLSNLYKKYQYPKIT